MKRCLKTAMMLLLAMACFVHPGRSQNKTQPLFYMLPSKAGAEEMLKRPLILCKSEMDEKEVEKLAMKKPDLLQFRKNYHAYYNMTIKMYFDRYYKGPEGVELKDAAEVDALMAARNSSVAVLIPVELKREFDVMGQKKSATVFSLRMTLPDRKNESFIISFLSDILSDIDFVFAVRQINDHLQRIIDGKPVPSYDYSNKATAGRLRNLKLIMNFDIIENKLTADDVMKVYPLPVEFSDSVRDYERIISESTPGYAYIMPVWSAPMWGGAYAMVDAGTGEIISILSAGGVHYSIAVPPSDETIRVEMLSKSGIRARTFDWIKFKTKYELKPGHIKRFAKMAMGG